MIIQYLKPYLRRVKERISNAIVKTISLITNTEYAQKVYLEAAAEILAKKFPEGTGKEIYKEEIYGFRGSILFEFFKNGELIGREVRSEEIVSAYGSIEKAARHLLEFYKENGRIVVKTLYKDKKQEFEVD